MITDLDFCVIDFINTYCLTNFLKFKVMKNNFLTLIVLALFSLASCSKTETVTVDTATPQGNFSKLKMGSLTAQNGTPTKGTVNTGSDEKGTYFVKFGSDFTTELGTGTVTVYLSTSATYKADPGKGNPDLKIVGLVSKNGEQFLKMSGAPDAKFTHVIIWCGSANVPFGNAPMN